MYFIFCPTGLLDLEYQNTSSVVAANWHGFSDTGSGIVQYHWCVGKTTRVNPENSKIECNVLDWQNVGMHTSVSRRALVNLRSGMLIFLSLFLSFFLYHTHRKA